MNENIQTTLRNACVPPAWTNNNCESINHVLKLAVDWKKQDLPTLIESTINDLIEAQTIEVERAIIGRGNYR